MKMRSISSFPGHLGKWTRRTWFACFGNTTHYLIVLTQSRRGIGRRWSGICPDTQRVFPKRYTDWPSARDPSRAVLPGNERGKSCAHRQADEGRRRYPLRPPVGQRDPRSAAMVVFALDIRHPIHQTCAWCLKDASSSAQRAEPIFNVQFS